jgi:hypothetical protein
VTNFGTTEHVANQLNALRIMHELAAPDGVMIHRVPSQGGFNHGLVNYTPKFFGMLARNNNYRWLWFDFLETAPAYPEPNNLIEALLPFRPGIVDQAPTYRIAECLIAVAVQKQRRAHLVRSHPLPLAVRLDLPRIHLAPRRRR